MSFSIINKGLLTEKMSVSMDNYITNESEKTPAHVINAFNADLSQIGFMFDGILMQKLQSLSITDLASFYTDLISNLEDILGSNVTHTPLFVNFPNNIPNDNEYFLKRIWGNLELFFDIKLDNHEILSCGHIINNHLFNLEDFGACPICQMQVPELMNNKKKIIKLSDITPFRLITLATDQDYYNMIKNICYSNTPLSEKHKQLIVSEIETNNYEIMNHINLSSITQKETLIIITGELLNVFNSDQIKVYGFDLIENLKTMTDVLRLASYLSKGDVSLKENTLFKLKNSHRNFISKASEKIIKNNIKTYNSSNTNDDLLLNKEKWVKLAHCLHVGSKSNTYPLFFKSIHDLRNKTLNKSVNGQIEMLIEYLVKQNKRKNETEEDILNKYKSLSPMFLSKPSNLDIENILKKLVPLIISKPGVFGRKLDVIVRNSGEMSSYVIEHFEKISNDITTPNLLKMVKHFENRNLIEDYRSFIPKGNIAKIKFFDDERDPIKKETCDSIINVCYKALKLRFSAQEKMGNVFLSEDLKNYLLPFSQRSASDQAYTLTRGSRVAFDEKSEAVRFFLYWKETPDSSRVDVDLSTVAFDENFNSMGHISYTRLSDGASYHSGDIQSAPNGASEFIDVNIDKYLEKGIRYVLMNVLSYTRQNFSEFEAFAGFMERQHVKSGEIFEPKTVKNKFSVNGQSTSNIPMVIDLVDRKIIWGDLSLSGRDFDNNVENNSSGINAVVKMVVESKEKTLSVFDLLKLQAESRGANIDYKYDSEKEYNYVFDEEFGTNIDELSSNWMS